MKKTLAVCMTALLVGAAVAVPAIAASAENDPVSICHTGNGTNFAYIAPDANGLNGHDNHEGDVFGLTEADCLAKNPIIPPPPPPVVDVDYTVVAWLAPAAPPEHFSSPQTFIVSEKLEDKNLDALDDELEAYRLGLACGVEVDIQVDGYIDDATTDALIAGGVLNGPNNPTEHLWGGGEGTAWKFVHLEGRDCAAPSGGLAFTPSYCDGNAPVGNSQGTLTLGAGTTATYTFNGGAPTQIAGGTYDVQVGTYVVTLTGENGATLVLDPLVVPEPKVVYDCLTVVQFTAPQFTEVDRCDVAGLIDTPVIEGVVWSIIFNVLTGEYTVDAEPADGFKFAAEVQTHWAGNLGEYEPCPEVDVCETSAIQPTATNLDPRGWELEGAEWVDGGLKFTASNWSDAYAFHTANFNLSEAAGLGLDLDIDGSGVWAIIFDTAAGNIHYEPEPYSLDFWVNAPGILPASPGGQGGDYAGNLEDIIGDPLVTGVYLYFSSGSETPVTATLHSGSYNCVTQPFAAAVVVTPPPATPPAATPPLPITGAHDPTSWLAGSGMALFLGAALLFGVPALRRRFH